MRRRRAIGYTAAAILLAALPAGWYLGSPWWTLWRIREAARAGDLATLAGYVDFARIGEAERAEAKRFWGSVLETPLRGSENSRQFIALAHRKLVEIRSGTAAFPSREDLRTGLAGTEIGDGLLYPLTHRRGAPCVVHYGLDGFEVRWRDMSREHGPVLTFERRRLGWRLVAFRWGQQ